MSLETLFLGVFVEAGIDVSEIDRRQPLSMEFCKMGSTVEQDAGQVYEAGNTLLSDSSGQRKRY